MENKSNTHCSIYENPAKKVETPEGLKLIPLTGSMRKVFALGGLIFTSAGIWAEDRINPNEIWLSAPLNSPDGICAKDIDQDGDLDFFKTFPELVIMLENIGTPISPEFAPPVNFVSNPDNLKLSTLGIIGNCLSYNAETLVDIDADGDLDLFKNSFVKGDLQPTSLMKQVYSRNDGTTEHPLYEEFDSQLKFGFPDGITSHMFKDIDLDGDQDLWGNFESDPIFFENTGSPENAEFVQQNTSPIEPLCDEGAALGFIIDHK